MNVTQNPEIISKFGNILTVSISDPNSLLLFWEGSKQNKGLACIKGVTNLIDREILYGYKSINEISVHRNFLHQIKVSTTIYSLDHDKKWADLMIKGLFPLLKKLE